MLDHGHFDEEMELSRVYFSTHQLPPHRLGPHFRSYLHSPRKEGPSHGSPGYALGLPGWHCARVLQAHWLAGRRGHRRRSSPRHREQPFHGVVIERLSWPFAWSLVRSVGQRNTSHAVLGLFSAVKYRLSVFGNQKITKNYSYTASIINLLVSIFQSPGSTLPLDTESNGYSPDDRFIEMKNLNPL
jgi:hypothetical protein